MKYEVSFSFYINNDDADSIARKNALLDALDTINEIKYNEVYDDGEDWCIECIATIECDAIRNINKALDHKIIVLLKNKSYAPYSYHYMKGIDNEYYWYP